MRYINQYNVFSKICNKADRVFGKYSYSLPRFNYETDRSAFFTGYLYVKRF